MQQPTICDVEHTSGTEQSRAGGIARSVDLLGALSELCELILESLVKRHVLSSLQKVLVFKDMDVHVGEALLGGALSKGHKSDKKHSSKDSHCYSLWVLFVFSWSPC